MKSDIFAVSDPGETAGIPAKRELPYGFTGSQDIGWADEVAGAYPFEY